MLTEEVIMETILMHEQGKHKEIREWKGRLTWIKEQVGGGYGIRMVVQQVTVSWVYSVEREVQSECGNGEHLSHVNGASGRSYLRFLSQQGVPQIQYDLQGL